MLRKGFLAALLLGAVGPLGPIASAAACDGDGQSPAQISQLVARQAILCLINDRRTEAGLSPLNENHQLDKAAQGHAHWMAKHNSYGHGNPANRIRRSGYLAGATAWRVGEILNWGTDQIGSPASIVASWMGSPEHRAVILGGFKDIGVGMTKGAPVRGFGHNSGTYDVDVGSRN